VWCTCWLSFGGGEEAGDAVEVLCGDFVVWTRIEGDLFTEKERLESGKVSEI